MPPLLLAPLQLFFAMTWVVYVVYLPALAEQVGLERRHVAMILMMDQLIFLACDWAVGMYADKVARQFGRIGGAMAGIALVSCAAFIMLPWIAPLASKALFLFLTIVWSATSSALRAPPFAIASRYSSAASQPWVAASYLFGLGAASAVAPYISIELRQIDPRIPFAFATIGLAAFAVALARAERLHPPTPVVAEAGTAAPSAASPALFAAVLLLFAFGYQVHFALNSGPSYLRYAQLSDLPRLMPIFWIGFNLALVPAAMMTRRYGGSAEMVVAGVVGALALVGCARAPNLTWLVIAQTLAGIAWSFALTAAFATVLQLGKPGREGLYSGVLFSMLAAAALMRVAITMTDAQTTTRGMAQLEIIPFVTWGLATFVMAMIAFPSRAKAVRP